MPRNAKECFICHICYRVFREKSKLRDHVKCHGEEKPYSCNLCSKKFSREVFLQIHRKTHVDEATDLPEQCGDSPDGGSITETRDTHYICFGCKKPFATMKVFVAHVWSHCKEDDHSCDKACGRFKKTFPRRAEYNCRRQHNLGTCNVCDQILMFEKKLMQYVGHIVQTEDTFATILGQNEHMIKHSDDGNALPKKNIARDHEITPQNPDKLYYNCFICKKSMSCKSKLAFVTHVRSHCNESNHTCNVKCQSFKKNFPPKAKYSCRKNHGSDFCNICDRVLKYEEKLKKYLGEKSKSGKYCGKSYVNKGRRNMHVTTHTEQEKLLWRKKTSRKHILASFRKYYNCFICKRSFVCRKARSAFVMHVRSHCDAGDHDCDVECERFRKDFPLDVNYTCVKQHGSGFCEVCDQILKFNGKFKKYVGAQTILEEWSCKYCGKNYASKGKRNKHVLKHTEQAEMLKKNNISQEFISENPDGIHYVCFICKKSFLYCRSRVAFVRHVRSHCTDGDHECGAECERFRENFPLEAKYNCRKKHGVGFCEVCDQLLKFNEKCDEYVGAKKTAEWNCKYCGKNFTTKYKRSEHMAKHTEQEKVLWKK